MSAGEETLVFQVASKDRPDGMGYERATTLNGERIYLIPGEGIPVRHVRTARVRLEAHRETYAVDVQLDKRGRKLLAALTGAHTAKRLAIRVGGDVILAPWITERVTGGVVSVTGDFRKREAEQLARMLTPEKRESEGADPASNEG